MNVYRWLRYLVFHLLRRLGIPIVSSKVNGSPMLLDLQTPGISSQLFVGGIREPEHTELVKEIVKPGMICLDIGANIGYYTLLMAELTGYEGHIHAFEPDPRNQSVLKANIDYRRLANRVTVYEYAISGQDGHAHFRSSGPSNLSEIGFLSTNESEEVLDSVEIRSLDSLAESLGPVDFLRMDVEGSEVEILGAGNKNFLSSSISDGGTIFVEVHPDKYSVTRSFSDSLQTVWASGFTEAYVISAGRNPVEGIEELSGVSKIRDFRYSGFHRGMYSVTSLDSLITLSTSLPKIVRYVILKKQALAA